MPPMPKYLVLGAGMVGSVMAWDLSRDAGATVTIADISEKNLAAAAQRSGEKVTPQGGPVRSRSAITKLAAGFDVVVENSSPVTWASTRLGRGH